MSHDPTEHVQEHLTHEAAHASEHSHGGHASRWITAAALTAAFLAAFAAVAAFLATTNLTESTHKRIDENDKWSYYQSKSLKNYLLEAKEDIVEATVKPESLSPKTKAKMAKDLKKHEENEETKTKTQEEARVLHELSQKYLETHEGYEFSATMFHIAIAIVAIAVVAKRKEFWYLSMVLGAIGVVLFARAFISTPPHPKEPEAESAKTAPEHPAAPKSPSHEGKSHEPTSHPSTAPFEIPEPHE